MKLRLISMQIFLGLGLTVGYTPTTQPFDYFYNKVKPIFTKVDYAAINKNLTSDEWRTLNNFVNASPTKERLSNTFGSNAKVDGYVWDNYGASKRHASPINVATVYVPQNLLTVIAEQKNTEKFKTDEDFKAWYDNKCTKDPIYQELYEPAINEFKRRDCTLAEKQARIKQLDQDNHYYAQATTDHEITHIIENHIEIKKKLNQKIAIGVGLIALPLTLSVLIHNKDKLSPVRNSIAVIAPMSYFSWLTYDLLGQKVSRDYERAADAGVRKDVGVLRACANHYARLEQKNTPLSRAADFLFYPLNTHPTDKARKDCFNMRADALEKQQQVNQAKK